MDFFRNLFKPDQPKFEKIIQQPQDTTQITEEIPYSDIKKHLVSTLPQMYFEESDCTLSSELESLSSSEDLSQKILQLEQFLTLSQQSLFFELDQHSENFSKSEACLQSLHSLLTVSQNLAATSKSTNESLQKSLSENYIKILYLSTRCNNLNKALKEFSNFQQFAQIFYLNIKNSLDQGNFSKALECCEEGLSHIEELEYKKFEVFKNVSGDLNGIKKKVLRGMREKLSRILVGFNEVEYENLILAYVRLGNIEEVFEVLTLNLETVNEAVLGAFRETVPHLPVSTVNYMIKITPSSSYLPVISAVLRNLTCLMHNFYLVLQWHEGNQACEGSGFKATRITINHEKSLNSTLKSYRKVFRWLKKLKKKVWDSIETQILTILESSCQIKHLKHGEMREFLEHLSDFVDCGQYFSGLDLEKIRNTVSQKCSEYFFTFHSTNWVKLVNLLEVEQWTKLPIPKTFEISSEISKNLKNLEKFSVFHSNLDNSSFSFSEFMKNSPFTALKSRKSFINSANSAFPRVSIQENPPVFCTSGINLFKIIGDYLELLGIFNCISFEIFHNLTQLVEFYVFEIFKTFSLSESRDLLFQEIMRRSITAENLDLNYDVFLFQSQFKPVQVNIMRIKDIFESLSGECENAIKQLHRSPASPASLTKALIALETYKNLFTALKSCKKFIKSSLPAQSSPVVDLFFSTHKDLYDNLSDFIIPPLLSRNFELNWLPSFIKSTKYLEKHSQASGFIHKLLKYFHEFSTFLSDPDIIPPSSQSSMLEKLAKLSFDSIFEGLCEVESCTLSGREQMKQDLRYFCKKIKKLTSIDSVKEIKEYISIWKYSADEIVNWVLANDGISLRKHRTLLRSAPGILELPPREQKKVMERVEKFFLQQIYN